VVWELLRSYELKNIPFVFWGDKELRSECPKHMMVVETIHFRGGCFWPKSWQCWKWGKSSWDWGIQSSTSTKNAASKKHNTAIYIYIYRLIQQPKHKDSRSKSKLSLLFVGFYCPTLLGAGGWRLAPVSGGCHASGARFEHCDGANGFADPGAGEAVQRVSGKLT
jgi:hypothetical protein